MRNTTFINDFTPSLHESLFNKAQRVGAQKAQERYDACMNGQIREEGPERLFAAILFGGVMRAEYANSKIRETISVLREDKTLYRHEVKRLCSIIRKGTAQYDTRTARAIDKDEYLDFFDNLCDGAGEQFDRLYQPFYEAMLRYMERNELRYADILARLECSVALLDFADKQFKRDVDEFRTQAPALMALTDTLRLPHIHAASELLSRVSKIATTGRHEHFDVNADEEIRKASDNLFDILGYPNKMNEFLVVDESLIPDRMK